ncbi:CDGSH iron-sulfur domain-containing protein [Thermanaerothrix sp.]|jgi:CDGSH-type Zn-finger protein|uniref:CDGSH iron-sulfur domain-containing protein n=1 Tax=Thermanaerothrix sp. TaxID=2972675 RepID=UPI002ADDFF82|nr:CDGSH iron-sulfur domain-containing protein [Thermanaerothrix sp.]
MAEHTTENRAGHLRTTVHLEYGEVVALCRCFKSKQFPFCDGTHKTLESEVGPVIVHAPKEASQPDEENKNN